MTCDGCARRQKNRAFCYFCQSVQRLPVCCECGKSKCMQQTGDCLARHQGTFATGMALVGAVCDFCEAWVCHSRHCLTTHACKCVLREDAVCLECKRDVWSHGGRMFRCCTCAKWLCEDDQFEHQASCQTMTGESLKCGSCNRIGTWACLRCKLCYCDEHVKSKTTKFTKETGYPCKKCHFPVAAVKDHSLSARRVEFGRKGRTDEEGGGDADDDDDDYQRPATFTFGGVTIRNTGGRRKEDEDDDDEEAEDDGEEDAGNAFASGDEDDDDGDDDVEEEEGEEENEA